MKPKDYPCEVLEEKVNSTNVSIIGISHDPDFMFEYESFFKEKISQSDAILLECEPYFKDGFFNEIGRLAYSQGKRVYNADPMSKATSRLDRIQRGLGFGLALSACLLGELYVLPVGLYFFLGSFSGTVLRYMPAGLLAIKKSTAPDPKNYYDIL